MAGGLLNIIYTGFQDGFLTKSPTITFFKVVYCKHSMFAIQDHYIQSESDVNFDESIHFKMRHFGDLLFRPYLKIDLPEIKVTYDNTIASYLTTFLGLEQYKNTNINIILSKLATMMHNYNQVEFPIYIDNSLGMTYNYESNNILNTNTRFKTIKDVVSLTTTPVSSFEVATKHNNLALTSTENINRNIYYSSFNASYLTNILNNTSFPQDIIYTNDDYFELFKTNLFDYLTNIDENKFLYSVLNNSDLVSNDMTSRNIVKEYTNELSYALDYIYSNMNILYIYADSDAGKTLKSMFFVYKYNYFAQLFNNSVIPFRNLYDFVDEDISGTSPNKYFISNGYGSNKNFNITEILSFDISGSSYDISFTHVDLSFNTTDTNVVYMIFPDVIPKHQKVDSANLDDPYIEDYYNLYYTNMGEHDEKIFNNDSLLLPVCILKYNSDTALFDKITLSNTVTTDDYIFMYRDVMIFDKLSQQNNFILINNSIYDFTTDISETKYMDNLYINNKLDISNTVVESNGNTTYFIYSDDTKITFIDTFNSSKSYFAQDFVSPYQIFIDISSTEFYDSRMNKIQYVKNNSLDLDFYTNLNYIKTQLSTLNKTSLQKQKIITNNMIAMIPDNLLYIKNVFESLFNDLIYFKFYNSYTFSNSNIVMNLNNHLENNYLTYLLSSNKVNGTNDYYNSLQSYIIEPYNTFVNNIKVTFSSFIRYLINLKNKSYTTTRKDLVIVNLLNNIKNNSSTLSISTTDVSDTILYTNDTSDISAGIYKSKIYFEINSAYEYSYIDDLSNNLSYILPTDGVYSYVDNVIYSKVISSDGLTAKINLTPYDATCNKLFYIFNKLIYMPKDGSDVYPITNFYVLPNDFDISGQDISGYLFTINRTTQNIFSTYDNIVTYNTAHYNTTLYNVSSNITYNNTLDINYILYHYAFNLFIGIKDQIYSLDTVDANNFTKYNDIKMYEMLWFIKQNIHMKQNNGNVTSSVNLNDISGSTYYIDCNVCVADMIDHTMINNSLHINISEYIRLYIKPTIKTLLSGKTNYFNFFVNAYKIKFTDIDNNTHTHIDIDHIHYIKLIQWFYHFLNTIKSDIKSHVISNGGLNFFESLTVSDINTLHTFFGTKSNIYTTGIYDGTHDIITEADYNNIVIIITQMNYIIDHMTNLVVDTSITLDDGSINRYLSSNKYIEGVNVIITTNLTLKDILYDLPILYTNQYYNNYEHQYMVSYFNTIKTQYIDMYETMFSNIKTHGSYSNDFLSQLSQYLNFSILEYEEQFDWFNINYNYDISNDIFQFKTNTANTLITSQNYYKFILINNPDITDITSRISDYYTNTSTTYATYKLLFDENINMLAILGETINSLVHVFNKYFQTSDFFYSDYRFIYTLYFYVYGTYSFTDLVSTTRRGVTTTSENTFRLTMHSKDNTSRNNDITNTDTGQVFSYAALSFGISNNIRYYAVGEKLYDRVIDDYVDYDYSFSIDVLTYEITEIIKTYSTTTYYQIINNKIYDPSENLLYDIVYDEIYDQSNNLVGSYVDTTYTINSTDYKYIIINNKQQMLYGDYIEVPIVNNTIVINDITFTVYRNAYYKSNGKITYFFHIPETDNNSDIPRFKLLDTDGNEIILYTNQIRASLLSSTTSTPINIDSVFTSTFSTTNNNKCNRYVKETIEAQLFDISSNVVVYKPHLVNDLLNVMVKNSILPVQNYNNDTIMCASFNNWKDAGNDVTDIITWLTTYNLTSVNTIKLFNQTGQSLTTIDKYDDISTNTFYFVPDRLIYSPITSDLTTIKETTDTEQVNYSFVSTFTNMFNQISILDSIGGTVYDDLATLRTKTELVKKKILDKTMEDISNNVMSLFYESNVFFDVSNSVVTWDNDSNNINADSVFIRNAILIDYDDYTNMNCLTNDDYTLVYSNTKYYIQDSSENLFLISLAPNLSEDISFNNCNFVFDNNSVLIDVSDSIFPKTLNIFNGQLYRYDTVDHGYHIDVSGNLIHDFNYDISINVLLKTINNHNYNIFNESDTNIDITCTLTDDYSDFSGNYLAFDNDICHNEIWEANIILDTSNVYCYIDSSSNFINNYVIINDASDTYLGYVTFRYMNSANQNLIKIYMHDTFTYDSGKTYTIQVGIKSILDNIGVDKLWYKTVFYFWETFKSSLLENKNIISSFDDTMLNKLNTESGYVNEMFSYISEIDSSSNLFKMPIDIFDNNVPYKLKSLGSLSSVQTLENNTIEKYRDFKSEISKIQSILIRDDVPKCSWVDYIGHYIIEKLQFKIDDNVLEEIDSQILQIYNHRNSNDSTINGLHKMIGHTNDLRIPQTTIPKKILHVPLPLCFSEPVKALPMIAMINSNLTLVSKIRSIKNLIKYPSLSSITQMSNMNIEFSGSYVYLDTESRERFAKFKHEYLYEIKHNYKYHIDDVIGELKLDYQNPCKEMLWFYSGKTIKDNKDLWNYTGQIYNLYDAKYPYNNVYDKEDDVSTYIRNMLIVSERRTGLDLTTTINVSALSILDINRLIDYIKRRAENPNPFSLSTLKYNGHTRFCNEGNISGLVVPNQYYNDSVSSGLNMVTYSRYPNEITHCGYNNYTMANDMRFNYELNLDSADGEINIITNSYTVLKIASGIACNIW